MISQYNISDPDKKYGVKNLGNVVSKRLKMQGFIVGDPDFGVRIFSVPLLPNLGMISRLDICFESFLLVGRVLALLFLLPRGMLTPKHYSPSTLRTTKNTSPNGSRKGRSRLSKASQRVSTTRLGKPNS